MKKLYSLLTALLLSVVSFAQTQMNLPVTFDDATINYGVVGFGGAEQSTIVTDPTLATNKVAKVIKTNTAELWAGTTVTAVAGTVQSGFSSNIPFTATEKRMNVRVWSPHAGIQVRLKVEDKNDGTRSVETEATLTTASGWQTLEFNFANPAAGTAAMNLAFAYNKASIFFNFGVTGATAGERIYYFDDLKFGAAGGGGGSTLPVLPLDFESATINYAFTDFGGGASTKVANTQISGINTSANVGKMVKGAGEVYGGSFIALAAPIDFSVNKTFKVKVFSPRVGAKLLLKVENGTDGSINFEREATSTVANAWEDLTFDYSAISTTNQYQKLVFIFDLGTAGNGSANFTWLFDDVRLTTAGGGGGLTQMNLPVTFDDATINYGLVGFGGAEQSTIVTDPTLATNKVAKVIKTNTAELWAGTTVTAVSGGIQTSFSGNIPFTATSTKMNVRVWSPHAGIKVRLKVEDKTDPTKSVETEATVTTASAWQTLEFNFANQAPGTAALNLAFSFNKASIFFNFGVTGVTAGERIYYFDDMKFGAIPPPAAPVVTAAVSYCQNTVATALTATATSGNTLLWYTVSTGGTGSATAPVPATTTAGTTNYYVSQVSASSLEGPRSLIAVTVNTSPAAPAVSSSVSICQNGGATMLAAIAATGNTLNWYTVATGGIATATAPIPATSTAGTTSYYVSQTNSQGCQSSRAVINVSINALPGVPVISAGPYTKLFPGLITTITTSGAVGTGNIYEWFKNDIMLAGQTANTLNVNVDGLGNYKMKITNASGCSNMSNLVSVSDSSNGKLFVYPNPSAGQFQVRFQSDVNNFQPRTLVIYNSKGSQVSSAKYVMFGAYTAIQVDLSNKPAGIYTVCLMDKDGNKLHSEKVIIYR